MTRGKRFNSPSALRPLPLSYIKVGELFTQQLFLFIRVYNCPSVYRGTRGKASEGVLKTHATEFSNSLPLRVLPLAKLFAFVVQSQTSLHCTHLLTTFHL